MASLRLLARAMANLQDCRQGSWWLGFGLQSEVYSLLPTSVYIYTCIYAHTYTHMYIYVYMHTHMFACICDIFGTQTT